MIDVVMPQMGESIVEGTLTKWLKKPGDRVERDEPLFEISTDKVDTEIPSPSAGTVSQIMVEEGKTVTINTVVAKIDESGAAAVSGDGRGASATEIPTPAPEPPGPEIPPTPEPGPESPKPPLPGPEPAPPTPSPEPPGPMPPPLPMDEVAEPGGPLSPLVRKMARENNLDLRRVKGTGAGGRITKQDIETHMAQLSQASVRFEPEPPPARVAPAAPPPQQPQPEQPQAAAPAPAAPPRVEPSRTRVEPMSIMRSKIAEHMVLSKRTSPHVTTVHKIDMTAVAKARALHKGDVQARYGYSLTYLPFVIRAASEALRAFPIVNASIEGSNILYHNEINIGIAVALESGLIVPVIRNADEKNVLGLQRSVADLAARARSRQLKPDEVVGGTFSITNFGSFGSLFGTPIINQPQVAILGVGAVEKTPVVVETENGDAIAVRSISLMGLTFDHRLIDGALADQFMMKFKSLLEGWSEQVL